MIELNNKEMDKIYLLPENRLNHTIGVVSNSIDILNYLNISEESRYSEISDYLTGNNIPFDCINENPPFITNKTGKIYYNILLDDRAGLKSAYDSLREALALVK